MITIQQLYVWLEHTQKGGSKGDITFWVAINKRFLIVYMGKIVNGHFCLPSNPIKKSSKTELPFYWG